MAGALDEAAAVEGLGKSAISWVLLIGDVFLSDTGRKATGADDFEPPGILPDENRAAEAVVTVADSIEKGLADGGLVEGGNIVAEEVLLEALAVVAEVDFRPEPVVEEQERFAEFLAVGGRPGGFGGAVFEDDLGLREVMGDGGRPAEKNEGGVGDAIALDQRAILEDLNSSRVPSGSERNLSNCAGEVTGIAICIP